MKHQLRVGDLVSTKPSKSAIKNFPQYLWKVGIVVDIDKSYGIVHVHWGEGNPAPMCIVWLQRLYCEGR